MANLFKRVRGATSNYVGSVSGDWNQIKNTVSSKFGSLENLSNTFDQRISDGLTDLLTGATGIRTSSIPEISSQVLESKRENRVKRQEVLKGAAVRAGDNPPKTTVLKYPENFTIEDGTGLHLRAGNRGRGSRIMGKPLSHLDLEREKWDLQMMRDEQTGSDDVLSRGTEEMTNYIHFRSLRRRVTESSREDHYDIFLYVPNTLSDAINTTYSEAEKGLTEGAIASIFPLGGTGWLSGNQFASKDEIIEILKSGAPGSDIRKATAGRTVNPLKFQLFSGVNMRTYTYNFEFRPLHFDDSKIIREIIYAFRKSMLPGTMGLTSRVYTFPNEWAIRYHGPIKRWIDYPMTTVCTNATVNWAPNGFVHMASDGAPATTTLSLTFTELVTLDRDRFDKRSSAFKHGNDQVREDSQVGSVSDINTAVGHETMEEYYIREAGSRQGN